MCLIKIKPMNYDVSKLSQHQEMHCWYMQSLDEFGDILEARLNIVWQGHSDGEVVFWCKRIDMMMKVREPSPVEGTPIR